MRNNSFSTSQEPRLHGTLIDWSQPDSLHLEGGDVLQLLRDPPQVPVAVTVSVVEGERVDLVYGGVPPPVISSSHSKIDKNKEEHAC